MLRESSTSTPRKFCCGTAAFRISVGRKQTDEEDRERAEAQADEHDAIAQTIRGREAAIGDERDRRREHDQHEERGQSTARTPSDNRPAGTSAGDT